MPVEIMCVPGGSSARNLACRRIEQAQAEIASSVSPAVVAAVEVFDAHVRRLRGAGAP